VTLRFRGGIWGWNARAAGNPADDGVLDETVAGLRDFLLLLVSGAELARLSDGDRAGEPIAEFDPVEKVLDRHAQLEIVDVAQDEHRFDDPTERLESGIKPQLMKRSSGTHKRIQEKSDGFDHMKNKRFCFPTVW